MKERHFSILLIEDNQDHAELMKRILENFQIENHLVHVDNGEAALDFLYGRGIYNNNLDCPRPHLILLDLRLPKIDGLEVLKQIKKEEKFMNIPVVILSSSNAEQDLLKAYSYHANSYLTKPVDYEEFRNMMKDLGHYWLFWNKSTLKEF